METIGPDRQEQLRAMHGQFYSYVLDAQAFATVIVLDKDDDAARRKGLEDLNGKLTDDFCPAYKALLHSFGEDLTRPQANQLYQLESDYYLASSKILHHYTDYTAGFELTEAYKAVVHADTAAKINWYGKIISEWIEECVNGKPVVLPTGWTYKSTLDELTSDLDYLVSPDAYSEGIVRSSEIDPQLLEKFLCAQARLLAMNGQFPDNVTYIDFSKAK